MYFLNVQISMLYAVCTFLMMFFHMRKLQDDRYEEERLKFTRIFTTTCLSIACKLRDVLSTKEPTRRTWEIRRYKHGLEDEFLHFPERKWLESYRISKDMFEHLVSEMQGLKRTVTRLRKPVSVRVIVAMLLKRLGKGLDYREIGDKFGVGASTACQKVNEAMQLLVRSKKHMISRLQGGADLQKIINGFQRKWNFPQCLGAIDGTHIPIKAPLEHHTDYFNRKCFHSIILQAVCDSQCCFTDVFAGWPGRAHDARVFGRSKIGEKVKEGRLVPATENLARVIDTHVIEPFLIGDPAYPLSQHLMKNYPGSNLPQEKENFNYRLSRARIQIERAFGRLKGRWRCLLRPLDCDLENVVLHVTTACILHNMCEEQQATYLEEWDRLEEDEVGDLPRPNPLQEDDAHPGAIATRNIIARYLSQH